MNDPLRLLRADLAQALVDAGFALHDCVGRGSAGGVCLTPADEGVIVTWGVGEALRDDDRYGTYLDVLGRMNAALAVVVDELGFEALPFGQAGATLVVGRRPAKRPPRPSSTSKLAMRLLPKSRPSPNAGHLAPDLPVVAEPCKVDTGPNPPSCLAEPKIDVDVELVCTSDTCFFLVTTCLEVNDQEFCSTTRSRPSRR